MTRPDPLVPLLLALCTGSFLLAFGGVQAAPPPKPRPSLTSFETVKVADGVYSFVAPETLALVSGNSTAIIGDDAVLVVDTGHFPTATRKMIAEVRRLTNKPVRFVVWRACSNRFAIKRSLL